MLKAAKKAAESADHTKSQRLWTKSKVGNPPSKTPKWLGKPTGKQPDSFNRNYVLEKIAESSYPEAKKIMEKYLTRFPTDPVIRARYLQLAIDNDDVSEIRRHSSLLNPPPQEAPFESQTFKVIILLITSVAIIWQMKGLYKAWASSKPDGHDEKIN